MQADAFKPPEARLDPDLVASASSSATVTWIARAIGGCLVFLGVLRMLSVADIGTRSGLGLGIVYLLCVLAMVSTLAGALVFMRSRHALAACLADAVLALLLNPWMQHMLRVWLRVREDDAFDYGRALSNSLHRPSPGWLFELAVIVFCMWDYRRRFAAWRQDAPSEAESPPVGSS